jgi:hypothetical protein
MTLFTCQVNLRARDALFVHRMHGLLVALLAVLLIPWNAPAMWASMATDSLALLVSCVICMPVQNNHVPVTGLWILPSVNAILGIMVTA